MLLIAGLGNPEAKYAKNRHNIGFMAVDALARHFAFPAYREKFHGLVSDGLIDNTKVLLLKPQTFMNLSGSCVAKFKQFFKINVADIFVIYDDIDLGFGEVKIKQGGGDAGHKGVRSISQHLQTKDFNRIRLGIGRPSTKEEVSNYVLSNFSKIERDKLIVLFQNLSENFEKIIQKNLP